ncbi:MAG: hypothetical protein E7637_07475 [Ruminococcaceae bacterium]|nr:hypothetical protein [Oscillospiraceae bacterium]
MKKPFGRKKKDLTMPEMPPNPYYETISARLGILQVVLYMSLFVFVILSILRNTELITYRNFYLFFKDLNVSFKAVDVFETDSVSYTTSEEQSFTLYRNGLAVVGNNSVTVFTETGRQTVSETISYKNPMADGSGKYLLVYEMGGTQYSLYNSFKRLYTGTTDYPIQRAVVSESGLYAIVSASKDYPSVVSLYNSHFSLINRYNKKGYVMDLDINAKGTQIAILSTSSVGGIYETELMLHRPKSEEKAVTVQIGSSLGVRCAYTASGGVGVLTGNGYCYVKDARVQESFDFGERSILSADIGSDGFAVCLRDGSVSEQNELVVFDKNGKLCYREYAPVFPNQVEFAGNTVFLLHDSGITRVNIKTGKLSRFSCVTDGKRILVQSEAELLLCSPQKAEFIHFS